MTTLRTAIEATKDDLVLRQVIFECMSYEGETWEQVQFGLRHFHGGMDYDQWCEQMDNVIDNHLATIIDAYERENSPQARPQANENGG